MRSGWALGQRFAGALALVAATGCQSSAAIITGVLELPGAISNASRPRNSGSLPTPSRETVAVIEQEHEQRMQPLRAVSAGLLAGDTFWLRGTARFVVVVRSRDSGRAVLGLEVAETREGSRVHVICAEPGTCAAGSTELRVETMRWIRENQLETAELVPALPLAEADLRWQPPFVQIEGRGDATPLRSLPTGTTPYAVARSPGGELALLRVRSEAGEQVTVVRIPERTQSL